MSAPDWTKIKPKRFDLLVQDLLEPAGRELRARAASDLLPEAWKPDTYIIGPTPALWCFHMSWRWVARRSEVLGTLRRAG